MNQKCIIFDLDGTLTDSGEGIMNCAEYALSHFGIAVQHREALKAFVGPPLDMMFAKFGVPADRTDEAIAVYRSRYTTIGKFENTPYDGITQLLQSLTEQGHRLFVATSKPEKVTLEIMEKFCLDRYFERICGASLDHSRSSKETVIAYLQQQSGPLSNAVMVGDTVYDVLGAKAHGIPAIGVAWGYGSAGEMLLAGAAAIAQTPMHLNTLLKEVRYE